MLFSPDRASEVIDQWFLVEFVDFWTPKLRISLFFNKK